MIEVKNLTKKYGNNTVVNNLNFKVEYGHIYGFLGPNGAGKSTTMNIITGCLAATEGQVLINGHDIFEEPIEAKKHIGYLPEFPPLYNDMTPLEYLRFVAEAKGIRGGDIAEEIEEAMSVTQITHMKDRLIKNLSKGYRQRVGIAQAMLGHPDIIILDEPTVGLDPKQIIEIRELIKSLGKHSTVILSSHILQEISAVCDYVLIIAKGNLVASDTLEKLSVDYTSTSTMHITVKGTEGHIRMALIDIPEILSYELEPSAEDTDCYALKITISRSSDIREQVFDVFATAGLPVLSMVTQSPSLEDVFLELTKDVETEKPQNDVYAVEDEHEIIICQECGAENSLGQEFCSECGVKLEVVDTDDNEDNETDDDESDDDESDDDDEVHIESSKVSSSTLFGSRDNDEGDDK